MLGFRAKGILRDLTNRYGKPARLVVQGENIELDAGTVQNLEPALLHLLRNAYDHGLESPQERVAAGKPEQGTIALSLRRQGKSYLLNLQDDGRGIDAKVIAKIAQDKKLPLTRTDTATDFLAVLCQPGFSSKSQVSDVSGRGVGMDVVTAQVANLGGRLTLDTSVGSGTTFHLQIPVPQLLVRCVLVQAGDRIFAIPAEEIVTTTLWSNLSATPAREPGLSTATTPRAYSWLIQDDGMSVPGLDLLEYWQKQTIPRTLSDTAVCMRIRSLSATSSTTQQDVWLLADDLLEQSDLLISRLPHPLIAPVGMMGVSLQNNGKLIPVLEPTTIAELLWTKPTQESQYNDSVSAASELTDYPHQPQQTVQDLLPSTRTILVVDDAALVRRRIEASLTAYGYVVHTCRDGLEAWNWLSSHPAPALIITDIEMPNMDGFTLIDRCRQKGMNLPIVVVSSRLSEEWGKEARRLGATDYITKGFTTPELIDKVNSYVAK
jgi:chemosensory pili system protein ChpA (sensor histidine kinase/response regulator)